MRRNISTIVSRLALVSVVLAFCFGMTGCAISKIKDIEVTSCGLESYSLQGLRSVKAVLSLGIDNPSLGFTITDLEGILKYNGGDFARYTADSVSVEGQCSKVYDLPCTATLSDGVGLMQIMQIAGNRSLEGFTTDVQAKVRLNNGVGKKLKFKNIDIAKLAE